MFCKLSCLPRGGQTSRDDLLVTFAARLNFPRICLPAEHQAPKGININIISAKGHFCACPTHDGATLTLGHGDGGAGAAGAGRAPQAGRLGPPGRLPRQSWAGPGRVTPGATCGRAPPSLTKRARQPPHFFYTDIVL